MENQSDTSAETNTDGCLRRVKLGNPNKINELYQYPNYDTVL
jgi:hypothetical protein